jgi:hypothetical protein
MSYRDPCYQIFNVILALLSHVSVTGSRQLADAHLVSWSQTCLVKFVMSGLEKH